MKKSENAADLESPANAPARAEFKLGIFPPDHHVPPPSSSPSPRRAVINN
jgi:hypothetical protein